MWCVWVKLLITSSRCKLCENLWKHICICLLIQLDGSLILKQCLGVFLHFKLESHITFVHIDSIYCSPTYMLEIEMVNLFCFTKLVVNCFTTSSLFAGSAWTVLSHSFVEFCVWGCIIYMKLHAFRLSYAMLLNYMLFGIYEIKLLDFVTMICHILL